MWQDPIKRLLCPGDKSPMKSITQQPKLELSMSKFDGSAAPPCLSRMVPLGVTATTVQESAQTHFEVLLERTYRGILAKLAVYETAQSEISYSHWLAEQTRVAEEALAEIKDPLVLERLKSSVFETLKESEPIRHAKIDLMKTLAGLVKSKTQVLINSQTWSQQIKFDWIISCRSVEDVLARMQDSDSSKILLKDYLCFEASCEDEFDLAKLEQAEKIFALVQTVQKYCSGMKDGLKRLGPCASDVLEAFHLECLQAIEVSKGTLDTELKSICKMMVEEAKERFQFSNGQDLDDLEEGEIIEKESRIVADKKKAQQESLELTNKYQKMLNRELSTSRAFTEQELADIHDHVKNEVLGDFNTKFGHLFELDFEEVGAALDDEFQKVQEVLAQKKKGKSESGGTSKMASSTPESEQNKDDSRSCIRNGGHGSESSKTKDSLSNSSKSGHRRPSRRSSDDHSSSKSHKKDRKTSASKSSGVKDTSKSKSRSSKSRGDSSRNALLAVSEVLSQQEPTQDLGTGSSRPTANLLCNLREKLQEQARLKATKSSTSVTAQNDQNEKSLTSSQPSKPATASILSPLKRHSCDPRIDFNDDVLKRVRKTPPHVTSDQQSPEFRSNIVSAQTNEQSDLQQILKWSSEPAQVPTGSSTEVVAQPANKKASQSGTHEPLEASASLKTPDFLNILITETDIILNASVDDFETTKTLPRFITLAVNSKGQVILPHPQAPNETINIMNGLTRPDGLHYIFPSSGTHFFLDKILALYFSLEIIRPLGLKPQHVTSIPVRIAIPAVLASGSRQQLLNGLQMAGFKNMPDGSTLIQITTAMAFGLSQNQLPPANQEPLIAVAYQQTTCIEAALVQVTKCGFHQTKAVKALNTEHLKTSQTFALVAIRNMAKRAKLDPGAITNKYLFVDQAAGPGPGPTNTNDGYHRPAGKWTRIYDPKVVLEGLRRISELCTLGKKSQDLYLEKFPYWIGILNEARGTTKWIVERDDDKIGIFATHRVTLRPGEKIHVVQRFGDQERCAWVTQASIQHVSNSAIPMGRVQVKVDSQGLIKLWGDKADKDFLSRDIYYMSGDFRSAIWDVMRILGTESQVPAEQTQYRRRQGLL